MTELQTAVAKLSNDSQEYSLRLQQQIAESRKKQTESSAKLGEALKARKVAEATLQNDRERRVQSANAFKGGQAGVCQDPAHADYVTES